MVDAAAAIRNRLLAMVVTLESKLEGKSEKEVRAQLERDLEAVSRDAYIRGIMKGDPLLFEWRQSLSFQPCRAHGPVHEGTFTHPYTLPSIRLSESDV